MPVCRKCRFDPCFCATIEACEQLTIKESMKGKVQWMDGIPKEGGPIVINTGYPSQVPFIVYKG